MEKKVAEVQKAFQEAAEKAAAGKKAAEDEAAAQAKVEKTEIELAFESYKRATKLYEMVDTEYEKAVEAGHLQIIFQKAMLCWSLVQSLFKLYSKWYNLYPWNAKPADVLKANTEVKLHMLNAQIRMKKATEDLYPITKVKQDDERNLNIFKYLKNYLHKGLSKLVIVKFKKN